MYYFPYSTKIAAAGNVIELNITFYVFLCTLTYTISTGINLKIENLDFSKKCKMEIVLRFGLSSSIRYNIQPAGVGGILHYIYMLYIIKLCIFSSQHDYIPPRV